MKIRRDDISGLRLVFLLVVPPPPHPLAIAENIYGGAESLLSGFCCDPGREGWFPHLRWTYKQSWTRSASPCLLKRYIPAQPYHLAWWKESNVLKHQWYRTGKTYFLLTSGSKPTCGCRVRTTALFLSVLAAISYCECSSALNFMGVKDLRVPFTSSGVTSTQRLPKHWSRNEKFHSTLLPHSTRCQHKGW